MRNWTAEDIPDQSGRTTVITGANSGLGLHSAIGLARKGARVLMACRSPERGAAALDQVRAAAPTGKVELVRLDLGDLGSVRAAAEEIRALTGDSLQLLMNNAGVMYTPQGTTADGFETQFGTNHLGHAALTWLLMPALRTVPGARVVTISSVAHWHGSISLDDPNFQRRRFVSVQGYGQSKLANLLFARELDRRARAAGLDLVSVAAHPGLTATELSNTMAKSRGSKFLAAGSHLVNRVVSQQVERGVLPQLYAATMPEVLGGQYYGPDGLGGLRGGPALASSSKQSKDTAKAAQLWELTAKLTGVTPDPE